MAKCECSGMIYWIDHKAPMTIEFPDVDQVIVMVEGECDVCGNLHQGTFEGVLVRTKNRGQKRPAPFCGPPTR